MNERSVSEERGRQLRRDQVAFFFDRTLEPVITIKSGQRLVLETEDANGALVRSEEDIYSDTAALFEKAGGSNPVTGPIFVEGAHPGDCLVVTLNSIHPGGPEELGYTGVFQHLGALESPYSLQEPLAPRTKILAMADGIAKFQAKHKLIEIPMHPFVGTIGTAPKYDRVRSCLYGRDYCGNVDCAEVTVGSKVVLPVNVEGGLLALGDCHGAQGAGEITGMALETRAEVDITVHVLASAEAGFVGLPQVNGEGWIGSIGCIWGATLDDNIRAAYIDLVRRMERYYGFDPLDAYILLNLVGRVSVGQVVDPAYYACVAMIDRRFVE
jgi:acetamidase/formamidase